MAFYDWNKDGKKDVQDDFIEYNIYKQSTNNASDNYSGGSSGNNFGCSFWIWFCVIIFFLSLVSECS